MRIITDNPELERHLSRMHDLIVSNGGFVHEEFVMDARNGDLRGKAPQSLPEGDLLISVPDPLLLPIDGFGLHLNGDEVCLGTPAAEITPLQIELMEAMAAIYNLSGKIQQHRKTSPTRIYLERPDVYERIVLGQQLKSRSDNQDEEFVLSDFIGTRKFGMKTEGKEDARHSVLMPLIDFLNHHQGASGFVLKDDALMVYRRSPIEGSDECFVSYARMDAQIAYVNYGFVDLAATYALSVPLKITLPGVVDIQVNRAPGAVRKRPIPPALKNIQRFVPRIIIDVEKKTVALSSLSIPDAKAPRALRRILMSFLVNFVRSLPPDQVQNLLIEAERQILDANRTYYKELIAYVSALDLPDELQQIVNEAAVMARHQLGIIDAYEVNIARLGPNA